MSKVNLDWIKHGTMNGDNDSIMTSLTIAIANNNIDLIRSYTSELWLRNISKEDFVEFCKTDKEI